MRPSTLATLLSTVTLASARIVGLAAPSTLAPNETFPLTLITENYIQAVADIAVAWGYSAAPGYPYTLGSFLSSDYIGPEQSNTLENVTFDATVPAGLSQWNGQEVVLAASVFSFYGASSTPTVANFNVTIKVGEQTAEDLVASEGILWGTTSE